MRVINAFLIALFAPISAVAVPITYSYTGELLSFSSTLPGVARALTDMDSTRISGWATVDLDADGTPIFEPHPQIFEYGHWVSTPHLSVDGEDFRFTPNDGTADTWHVVSHTVDPSGDSTYYSDSFSRSVETPAGLMLQESGFLSVDFLGLDLLGTDPKSLPDPLEFVTGAGRFSWMTFDEQEMPTILLEGVFLIDSIAVEPRAVPTPATWTLLSAALVLLMLGHKRRRQPAPPTPRTLVSP